MFIIIYLSKTSLSCSKDREQSKMESDSPNFSTLQIFAIARSSNIFVRTEGTKPEKLGANYFFFPFFNKSEIHY
jgi:hypothetical protein